eukprot:2563932-Amphidinium_carterae.1
MAAASSAASALGDCSPGSGRSVHSRCAADQRSSLPDAADRSGAMLRGAGSTLKTPFFLEVLGALTGGLLWSAERRSLLDLFADLLGAIFGYICMRLERAE